MTVHAWENYKLYAWGKNELRPLSKRAHTGSIFGAYDLGATIVDGLDTLYIMNLKQQYQEGREWVQQKFSFKNMVRILFKKLKKKYIIINISNFQSAELSVFETNIRFVGGLLTLYAFTGDTMYKDKAQEVADKLLPAFQTPTGIPNALVNIRTGYSKNYGWASGGSSILSEFGTLHLEFAYLSDVTGNPVYRERVMNIRQLLKDIPKPNGLYPNYLNPKTGKWGQQHISLGALGDSFYEYLLKAWLQSGQTDGDARQMYDDAMEALVNNIIQTSPSGLIYASDMKFERLEHKMDHLACFSGKFITSFFLIILIKHHDNQFSIAQTGGLFALGAATQQDQNSEKYMDIGKGITNTCHESYIRTSTHLGPEAFRYEKKIILVLLDP